MGVWGWTSEHKRNLTAIAAAAMRDARADPHEWASPLPLKTKIQYIGDYTVRYTDGSVELDHDVYEIGGPDTDHEWPTPQDNSRDRLAREWYDELLKGDGSAEERDIVLELIMRLGITLRAGHGGH